MKYGIHTLDDFDWRGKVVLCRVDINAPLDPETGGLRDITRLKGCAPTVRELAEEGARVVLLAHQGGDLEYHNYASTEPHAPVMAELTGHPVAFIDDVCGPAAREAIGRLADGDVLLLDNVRFCGEELTLFETKLKLSPEDQAKTLVVRKLAPLADLYVCDAFAAAHRSQPTLVGFEQLLPSAMGRLFEKEYANLARLREEPARPCVFVLGGTKIQEAFPMMAAALADGVVDTVLTAGLVANVMLAAKGVDIGAPSMDFIRASQLDGFIEESKAILAEHGEKIVLPLDVAYVEGRRPAWRSTSPTCPVDEALVDIGHATVAGIRGADRRRRHRVRQRARRRLRAAGDRVRDEVDLGGDGRLARVQRPRRRRQRHRHEPLRPRRPLRLRLHGRRRHGAVPQRQADAGHRGAQRRAAARVRLTAGDRRRRGPEARSPYGDGEACSSKANGDPVCVNLPCGGGHLARLRPRRGRARDAGPPPAADEQAGDRPRPGAAGRRAAARASGRRRRARPSSSSATSRGPARPTASCRRCSKSSRR